MDLSTRDVAPTVDERSAIESVLGAIPPASSHDHRGGHELRQRRHLLLATLHAVNDRVGWISQEAIDEIAARFGNQVLVLSLDARRETGMPSGFGVTTHGGRRSAGRDAVEWAREAVGRGVGEVLLNSMDADGTTNGFDLEMLAAVRAAVDVPLIASGGAGTARHFVEAADAGADALLAASVFHYGHLSVAEVKSALAAAGHIVREGVSR